MKHNILPIPVAVLAAAITCRPAMAAGPVTHTTTGPSAKTVYSCDFNKRS